MFLSTQIVNESFYEFLQQYIFQIILLEHKKNKSENNGSDDVKNNDISIENIGYKNESNDKKNDSSDKNDNKLDISVLNAALYTLLAMTSSGTPGLYSVLESVAEAGFNLKENKPNNNDYNSMSKLKNYLMNLNVSDILGLDDNNAENNIIDGNSEEQNVSTVMELKTIF